MTQHARIVSGEVVEILTALDDHALADCFPKAIVAECVDAPDDVRPGWTYDGKVFTAPAAVVTAPVVRSATSYDLVSVLSDDEVAALGKAKPKDQHLFGKRNDAWPEDNPKIARFATALGTTPKAWFDRVAATAAAAATN